MPSIKDAIAHGDALRQMREGVGVSAAAASGVADAPAMTPMDMPIGLPQRGMFPANFVLSSDRSDSSREFRGMNTRTASFPYPNTPAFTVTGTPATFHGIVSQGIIAQTTPPAPTVSPQTTQTMDTIPGGIVFGKPLQVALDGQGNIDPSQPGVLAKGSIPPVFSGVFTYASTISSITWSWTGLVIYRADGLTTTITDGSQAITGLALATTYYFYPYWDEISNQLAWVTTSSGNGTPAYAYLVGVGTLVAAQTQALQNQIPLSTGGMSAVTGGGSGGGGGGGGAGVCLRNDTLVECKTKGIVPIEQIEVGDEVLNNTGWQEVVQRIQRPQSLWVRVHITDDYVDATPTHPFTLADGTMKRAQELSVQDFLVTKNGYSTPKKIEVIDAPATKVTLFVTPDHTFFGGHSAPVILTHNPGNPS